MLSSISTESLRRSKTLTSRERMFTTGHSIAPLVAATLAHFALLTYGPNAGPTPLPPPPLPDTTLGGSSMTRALLTSTASRSDLSRRRGTPSRRRRPLHTDIDQADVGSFLAWRGSTYIRIPTTSSPKTCSI